MARIEASYGTQLDTNYYHYLNTSTVNSLSANGYFTGSGLPQRFIDSDGNMLGIYQAATQWPDEWFANAGLTAGQTTTIVESMLSRAESLGFYSAFVNNIHPVRYDGGDDITNTWINNVWAYCQQHNIPMWSAEMLLNFTRARDSSQFLNIDYTNGRLDFDFAFAGVPRTDLTIMIPATWKTDELASLEINGAPITWVLQTIKGIEYAMFTPQIMNGHVSVTFVAPFLPGDYNHDGSVDAGDYVMWRSSLGSRVKLAADGNGNQIVDEDDYTIWRNNFGRTQAAQVAGTVVPEQDSIVLILIGLAFAAFARSQGRLFVLLRAWR